MLNHGHGRNRSCPMEDAADVSKVSKPNRRSCQVLGLTGVVLRIRCTMQMYKCVARCHPRSPIATNNSFVLNYQEDAYCIASIKPLLGRRQGNGFERDLHF